MALLCYSYEADHHCISCTVDRFGDMLDLADEPGGPVDGEGNPVHVMLDGEEWYANDIFEANAVATLACGTCGEVIEEIEFES